MNTECDRLSSLSDDLIIKILSYINTKQAIKTSILSPRWKNIWKSISHLDLSTEDDTFTISFHDFACFLSSLNNDSDEFSRVLSSRNNEIELSSVKLSVHQGFRKAFVQTVINYAFSHNVQEMNLKWLDIMCLKLPDSLFMSQSLKDFTLIGPENIYNQPKINSSFDLPALTTLHLENVTLSNKKCAEYGGLFSKCPNLTNLTLFKCDLVDPDKFIRHSEFSKLKPETGLYSYANVVVPHVKNLSVVNCQGRLMLYAPELSSLMYETPCYETFYANGLSCLEKVDFYMCPFEEDSYAVVEILQGFHNVKFLTLGLEIFEVPSFESEVSGLPSPFGNLTSLKIWPRRLDREKKVNISTKVKNFLLGGAPNATVTIYSREEMKELKDVTSAQRMMAKFPVVYPYLS